MELPIEITATDGGLVPPDEVIRNLMKIKDKRRRWHALIGAYVFAWGMLKDEKAKAEAMQRAFASENMN